METSGKGRNPYKEFAMDEKASKALLTTAPGFIDRSASIARTIPSAPIQEGMFILNGSRVHGGSERPW